MSKKATVSEEQEGVLLFTKSGMAEFVKERKAGHYATVPVTGWNRVVRLKRLSTPEQIDLKDRMAELAADPNGKLSQKENAKFAAEFAARCIVTQGDERPFDTDGGRAFLELEDIDVLSELLGACCDLHGWATEEEEVAKTKKK